MQIKSTGKIVKTCGLQALEGKELQTRVDTIDLVADAASFLSYVSNYLETTARHIRDQETLAYGYWLTHFAELEGHFDVNERSIDGKAIVPGVTLAVTYWRIQNQLCAKHATAFVPPAGSSLVVVSDGIMNGAPSIQGVRYPAPPHMSGWWLTDDGYDGNVSSLTRTHAYHLAAVRPDLVHMLALPYGYRFDLRHHEDVWFDEAVAGEPA